MFDQSEVVRVSMIHEGPPRSGGPPPQGPESHGEADGTPSEAAASTDRELLDAMVAWQVVANRAHAARLEALTTFHDRRVAEREQAGSGPAPGWFALTPLRETQAETAPLTGVSEFSVRIDLDRVGELKRWLPRLWDRCRRGRLDLGKATACLDQLVHLATDTDRAAYAAAVQDWFDRLDPSTGEAGPLCTLTRDRIQRAAYYQRLKLPRRPRDEGFAQAFAKRRVSLRVEEETGMACLSVTTAAHDALTADHRLTLIAAKRAQTPGETRTLAQLRVDSLLDLIHGRLTVPATTGDLDHHQGCDTTCHAPAPEPDTPGPDQRTCPLHPLVLTTDTGATIGGYARPVVAVTVPYTTLIGLTDHPGVLSGGHPVPADYVRHLAGRPGSTWHRMLTDPAGRFLELSTAGYQPTDPIWRAVTLRDQTCVWPGCRRPSTSCECDHRTPYPQGRTCIQNLAPLCTRHHQVKHADGYHLAANPDGSYTWTTRHGSTLTTPAGEQPVASRDLPDQDQVDAEFAALTSPLERGFAALLALRR